MLFVVDVGNTNITCGVYEKERLVKHFRITTRQARTSDEYGMTFCSLLGTFGVYPKDITGIIIASVVPGIMHSLTRAMSNYLGQEPMILEPGMKTGITIETDNPREIGADRIVDAAAGFALYGGPILVMDFGTATTYDLITEQGVFTMGITSPGLRLCADALWKETAQLPEIPIALPPSILAKNTVTSMQAGLVYGAIGQTEYIIRKVREESGYQTLKTVATGGLGRIIGENTKSIQVYDPELTLTGLRIIYEMNASGTQS